MSRLVIALLLVGGAAHAEEAAVSEEAKPDPSDQIIGASVGVAVGGRVTPGGLRVSGHYHYQLAERDWFDGRASFTFGTGGAECFRDRMDQTICDHGLADGKAVEVSANVRRFFGTNPYMPFARLGLGVALVRFGDDDVTGVAFPLHAGVGLRVLITDDIAVSAEAEVEVGVGGFNRRLGAEPQLGSGIAAGAEFRL